jgi:hypothetical protein
MANESEFDMANFLGRVALISLRAAVALPLAAGAQQEDPKKKPAKAAPAAPAARPAPPVARPAPPPPPAARVAPPRAGGQWQSHRCQQGNQSNPSQEICHIKLTFIRHGTFSRPSSQSTGRDSVPFGSK